MTPDTPRRPTTPSAKKPQAKKPQAKKPQAKKPPAQRSAQTPPRTPTQQQPQPPQQGQRASRQTRAQPDSAAKRPAGRTAQQAQRSTSGRQAKTTAPAGAAPATGRNRRPEPSRRKAKRASAAPVLPDRRYRQRISRIDMWSAAKISICFYLSALIVLLVAGVVLWSIASAAGAIGNIEDFMQDAGFEDFRFLSGQIIRGSVLIGLAWVAIAEIFTLVAVGLYNLFAELIGGVEVHVREENVERG